MLKAAAQRSRIVQQRSATWDKAQLIEQMDNDKMGAVTRVGELGTRIHVVCEKPQASPRMHACKSDLPPWQTCRHLQQTLFLVRGVQWAASRPLTETNRWNR